MCVSMIFALLFVFEQICDAHWFTLENRCLCLLSSPMMHPNTLFGCFKLINHYIPCLYILILPANACIFSHPQTPFSTVTENEIVVLKETFKELAKKGGHDTYIDKQTFLKFFPLPGLLGGKYASIFPHNSEIQFKNFYYMQRITLSYKYLTELTRSHMSCQIVFSMSSMRCTLERSTLISLYMDCQFVVEGTFNRRVNSCSMCATPEGK